MESVPVNMSKVRSMPLLGAVCVCACMHVSVQHGRREDVKLDSSSGFSEAQSKTKINRSKIISDT